MRLHEINPNQADDVIINEFISSVYKDAPRLNEGLLTEANFKNFKTLVKQNSAKLKSTLSKVKNPAQAINDIQAKFWTQLQLANTDKSKLMAFAKKHAKYVKPAIMISVIGATLIGADHSTASSIIDALDQMPLDQVQDLLGDAPSMNGTRSPINPDEFLNAYEEKWTEVGNQVTHNGKPVPFKYLLKAVEQHQEINTKEFVEWMNHKGLSSEQMMGEMDKFMRAGIDKWQESIGLGKPSIFRK